MTLKNMSAQYQETAGQAFGFGVKSGKTGKTFIAIAQGVNGKIILQSMTNRKEMFEVDGDVDRYSFTNENTIAATGSTTVKSNSRVSMIESKMSSLELQRSDLEGQVVSLEEQLSALEDEIGGLDDQISALEDELAILEG